MYRKREVRVTRRGPAVLALLVIDSADCGGVHPFGETFPLVYDLRRGKLVKWGKVLTKGRVREIKTGLDDGTSIIVIESALLKARYVARYKESGGCDIASIAEVSEFLLYPDETKNALEFFPIDLPQVGRICAKPLSVDSKALKALGVSEEWQNTILSRGAVP
jgi:hypothetical protein